MYRITYFIAIATSLMTTQELHAQVTGADVLAAAQEAKTSMSEAVNMKGGITNEYATHMFALYFQLNRILINYDQLTAQQRIDCSNHLNKFFKAAKNVQLQGKLGNEKMRESAEHYYGGILALTNGQYDAAKANMDLAKSKAHLGKAEWFFSLLDTALMRLAVKDITTILDSAGQ